MILSLCLSVAIAANPFRVEVQPLSMTENEVQDVLIIFVVPEGYHLYQDMMSVVPKITEGIVFSSPIFPMGQLKTDPANPDQLREVFDTTIQVKVPVTSKKSGVYTTELTVQYQGCKETLCYMPKSEVVPVTISVEENAEPK